MVLESPLVSLSRRQIAGLLAVLQEVRGLLKFGDAQDPRMPPHAHSGHLTSSSPEAQLIHGLRFRWRTLEHVTDAFCATWDR